ncbi:hypothetical protein [uncultured Desulfuromusa sp.]|uniref:hypothetical protein n=1 Tax=uncultured Desulfuromusa sp. TaxID=219183 RepID=UPI002AA63CCB|nr:hypothetical protein [uncultured Desulfuromusa sp.]
MSGITGMRHSRPRRKAKRNQIWQSIRILRRFTLPDLCRTIPGGVSYTNVRKFVSELNRHGIVKKVGRYVGGRTGEYQQYQLVIDSGPTYPTQCPKCKQKLSAKHCEQPKENIEEKSDDDIRPAAAAAR